MWEFPLRRMSGRLVQYTGPPAALMALAYSVSVFLNAAKRGCWSTLAPNTISTGVFFNFGALAAIPAVADSTMISRSPSVLTAEVDGEVVMMSIEQGRYFGLDDIGSDIWKRLDTPCSFAELIGRLAVDYDADRAAIAADVRALLGRMAEQDVVRLA